MSSGEDRGVRVVCRLRPMSDREKKVGTVPAASASTERKEVSVLRMLGGGTRQTRSAFHFDEVLNSFSTQSEVFAATLDSLVDEVLAGYEATAFAYGQTGTGKTYTMEGDLDSDEARGLVPRTAAAIIERLASGAYVESSVSCSYLEIYNEELGDLLAPVHCQQRLDLKDIGGGKGVLCTGLSEVAVSSLSDILDLVRRAQERRRVADTRMNARSSRSHCIFTIKVKCKQVVAQGELDSSGTLHLVDLAGSECAKKALGDDTTPLSSTSLSRPGQANNLEEERERKNINQSLLTLGRVISALRDGTKRVPYRDSKLTRLLQDALGGRCKTVIIATISPALSAVEETISTLTYAEHANGVKNRPVCTSHLRSIRLGPGPNGVASGFAAIGGEGSGSAGCGSDFAEMELKLVYLAQELEEAEAKLGAKYRETQEQIERANLAEKKMLKAEQDVVALKEAESLAREQVRNACNAAATRSEELLTETRARSEALHTSVAEVHQAHREGMNIYATFSSTQASTINKMCSAATGCGQYLDASLGCISAGLRENVQLPLTGLQSLLVSIVQGLDQQGITIDALQADEVATANVYKQKWSKLRNDLHVSHEADARTSSAHRASHRELLSSLRSSSDCHGKACAGSFVSLCYGLEKATRDLITASECGHAALSNDISKGNSVLVDAWEAELKSLNALGGTLTMAESEQRAANASESLQANAAEAATELSAALAASLTSLASSRNEVASQVAELQKQRAAEQAAVNMLCKQREALQADTNSLNATLRSVKQELADGRSQLDALAKAQEKARLRVFESVSNVLRSELSMLGTELSEAASATSSKLVNGERLVEEASHASTAAENRSALATQNVMEVVKDWSQDINAKCSAIEAARERSREAAISVEAASKCTIDKLYAIEAASTSWGSRCEEVTSLIANANTARGDLAASIEAVAPIWQTSRSHAEESAKAYVDDITRVKDVIATLASDAFAGKDELDKLNQKVCDTHTAGEAALVTQEENAKFHHDSLSALAECMTGLEQERTTASERRCGAVQEIRKETTKLATQASQCNSDADKISAAIATGLAALPPLAEEDSRSRVLEEPDSRFHNHWQEAVREQKKALQVVHAVVDDVQGNFTRASTQASEEALKELNRGELASSAASEAIEEFTMGLASSLSSDALSFRGALSSPPLDVFNEFQIKEPDAASCPDAGVFPKRPTEEHSLGGRVQALDNVAEVANKENAPGAIRAKTKDDGCSAILTDKAESQPRQLPGIARRGLRERNVAV